MSTITAFFPVRTIKRILKLPSHNFRTAADFAQRLQTDSALRRKLFDSCYMHYHVDRKNEKNEPFARIQWTLIIKEARKFVRKNALGADMLLILPRVLESEKIETNPEDKAGRGLVGSRMQLGVSFLEFSAALKGEMTTVTEQLTAIPAVRFWERLTS